MNYEVRMTPDAQRDLRGIFEYIAFQLQSFQNAAAQLDRLETGINALEQMPERFRAYEREPWRSRGLRVMGVDRYLVFYIPDREKATVTVIRVLYGGMDVDKRLEEMLINFT